MKNQEIAKRFYGISEMLEMDNVPFKPYACQKAAITLETLKDDIKPRATGGRGPIREDRPARRFLLVQLSDTP